MDERLRFVRDALSDRFTMSELCARYGVSRRIGYKWLARYDTEGRPGLRDRSRAPHSCPHKIAEPVAQRLLVSGSIPIGALRSCSTGSGRAILRWVGRPSARRAISSPATAWCSDGGADGRSTIRASRHQ